MCTVSQGGGAFALLAPAANKAPQKRRAAPSPQGVRRRLFGGRSGATPPADLDKELRRSLDAASARWGFDFQGGRPQEKPGLRYAWTKTAPPPAPTLPTLPPVPSSPPQRQTKITDYLMPRKRAASGDAVPPSKMARPNNQPLRQDAIA